MINVGTRTIETERLILRKLEISDLEQVYNNWCSDPKVSKYVTWDMHKNIEQTKEYINFKLDLYKKDYRFDWVVVIKETNEVIGEIDAVKQSLNYNLVELGYCYGSKYWNNGYATEALSAVIKYLKEVALVEKVTACHISTNPASGRVMQKAGMKYDATLKEYVVDKNTKERADLVYYSC